MTIQHTRAYQAAKNVARPLASVGVGLFIDELLDYKVIEKSSNNAFQALWIKIFFSANKNIICEIIHRQHNSPEVFQTYFEETIEKFCYD